jgi:hypothetical protein
MKVMKITNFLVSLTLFQIFSCKQMSEFPQSSKQSDSLKKLNRESTGSDNLVLRSADNGQTWQDITEGLPKNLRIDSIPGNSFFANDTGLFIRYGNGLFHSLPNATAPFWTKEIISDKHSSMVPDKSEKVYWGINLISNGTSVWSPIFEIYQEPRIRSVFETAGGTIFIGIDRGIFKTDNRGNKWKQVHTGSLVGHLAESDGVLVAISTGRIIRSTDNGENWTPTISEDGFAFDVKPFRGGFVAITAGSEKSARRLSSSFDGGKTWQPIHSELQNKVVIDSLWRTWDDRLSLKAFSTSIIPVGENFYCTHPEGIFSSSDNGKTWKLLLPSIKGKGYNLFVSGNMIYAIPKSAGC